MSEPFHTAKYRRSQLICYKVYTNGNNQLLEINVLEQCPQDSLYVERFPYALLLALLDAHSMVTASVYGQLIYVFIKPKWLVTYVHAKSHNNVVGVLVIPSTTTRRYLHILTSATEIRKI